MNDGTESVNPATARLDEMSALEMARVFHEENIRSVNAVEAALPAVAEAIDAAAAAIAAGGRIIYVGAGTSGRLAVQDASECPPTYGTDPDRVVAVIAGGRDAVFRSAEGVEDSADAGERDLMALNPCANDFVVGISASGGAEYVISAIGAARAHGAKTAAVVNNAGTRLAAAADIAIVALTGAEPVSGSTRMKAGNAQKMILNMISTGAMVKTGKVIGNLMVNLRPVNRKLRARMVSIVRQLASCSEEEAVKRLDASDWSIRAAVK